MKFYTKNHCHYHYLVSLTKRAVKILKIVVVSSWNFKENIIRENNGEMGSYKNVKVNYKEIKRK